MRLHPKPDRGGGLDLTITSRGTDLMKWRQIDSCARNVPMKGRLQWMLGALLAVAVGCQDQDAVKRALQRKEADRAMEQYKADMREKTRALREQLKQGLQPVVDCALEKFGKEVAIKYGANAVKQGKITPGAASVKKMDDGEVTLNDVWEVPIRYVGRDADGKDVDEQWIAQVVMMLGSMDCVSLQKK